MAFPNFLKLNFIVNQIIERRLLISDVGIIRQETRVWHKFWDVHIPLLLLRYFKLQRQLYLDRIYNYIICCGKLNCAKSSLICNQSINIEWVYAGGEEAVHICTHWSSTHTSPILIPSQQVGRGLGVYSNKQNKFLVLKVSGK